MLKFQYSLLQNKHIANILKIFLKWNKALQLNLIHNICSNYIAHAERDNYHDHNNLTKFVIKYKNKNKKAEERELSSWARTSVKASVGYCLLPKVRIGINITKMDIRKKNEKAFQCSWSF